jgi:hypothetical protein
VTGDLVPKEKSCQKKKKRALQRAFPFLFFEES